MNEVFNFSGQWAKSPQRGAYVSGGVFIPSCTPGEPPIANYRFTGRFIGECADGFMVKPVWCSDGREDDSTIFCQVLSAADVSYTWERVEGKSNRYNIVNPFGDAFVVSLDNIGTLDKGDGYDRYVLLTRHDDDVTPTMAHDWMCAEFLDAGSGLPGTAFCHQITTVAQPKSSNKVICIIHRRYDI